MTTVICPDCFRRTSSMAADKTPKAPAGWTVELEGPFKRTVYYRNDKRIKIQDTGRGQKRFQIFEYAYGKWHESAEAPSLKQALAWAEKSQVDTIPETEKEPHLDEMARRRIYIAHRVLARYLEAKPTGRAKGWETRREQDDFAKQNIPEEYHALWEKVKSKYKGTPDQRAEQFMEWVESGKDLGVDRDSLGEGEQANIELQMEQAERLVKEQQKRDKKETLCRKRCPSCYTDNRDDLEDAPF